LESSFYKKEAVLKEHCLFESNYRNVLIHSKWNPFKLREVTEADAKIIFDWANDSEVRLNSLNQKPISWEDHLNWFRSKINNSNSKMYILEENGFQVGQVRFDFCSDVWVVDYSIDKFQRGKGFGFLIIMLGVKEFKNSIFVADVKKENLASRKVFLNLGFHLKGCIDDNLERYIFEKK
jgi:RimJ/RimL family protein N-acetyltransferase